MTRNASSTARTAIAAVFAAVIGSLLLGTVLASPAAAATTQTWEAGETGSDGAPVAWSCGTQLVYLYGAPTGAHGRLIAHSLKKLNTSSSTKFVLAGSATRSPLAAGGSDKAVVIGFDHFDAKYAGYAARGRDGDRYISGYSVMNLNVSYIANPSTPDDWKNFTNTVLHELGHLVGLDHVTDDTQVMFGSWNAGHSDYGTGDRQGLRHLRCRTVPAAQPASSISAPAAMAGDALLAATGPALPMRPVRRI